MVDRLTCDSCNKCCQRSGLVLLTDADFASLPEGIRQYALPTVHPYTGLSGPVKYVIDVPFGSVCVFSTRRGCYLGDNKPESCRNFPSPDYYAKPRMRMWLKENCALYEEKEG